MVIGYGERGHRHRAAAAAAITATLAMTIGLTAPAAAAPAPQKHVTMGVFFKSLPMIVAQKNGFFSKNGLDVTYAQVSSSRQQFKSLADGTYDIVQTAVDNVAAYHLNKNNPLGRRKRSAVSVWLVTVVRVEVGRDYRDWRGGG
jgi:ABC-type nitrate/sulfonate/bicarbonate transport system substrate-binding protein